MNSSLKFCIVVLLGLFVSKARSHPGHLVMKFYQTSTVSPIDLVQSRNTAHLTNSQFVKHLPNCTGWNKRRCEQRHLEEYLRDHRDNLPAGIRDTIKFEYPYLNKSSDVRSSPVYMSALLAVYLCVNRIYSTF